MTATALRRLIEALLIATLGGIAFDRFGVPAGLISGAMVAVAVAAVAGRPVAVPPPVQRVAFVCIGITLGSVVTPETLHGLTAYPVSITILVLCTICMTAAATLYLHRVHRWSPLAALFGASPGALAQVIALSADTGVDLRAVAIVQSVRVVLLTIGLPSILAAFGLAADMSAMRGMTHAASLSDLAILIVASLIPALVLQRVGFTGGALFGAMLGSGALHGTGFIQGGFPWWVTGGAAIVLGAITGSRFAGTTLRMLMNYLAAAIGSFSAAMIVAGVFMVIAAASVDVPIADIVIAFAPGAQDTMMMLALVLNLDPVFVGIHHISRFMLVSLSIPFVARFLTRPGDQT
jgi:membrane AbrB-like protein